MRRAFAIVTIILLLAGCGQKGPLYRPGGENETSGTAFAVTGTRGP